MIEKTKGLMYPIVKDPLGFFRSSQGSDSWIPALSGFADDL